MTVASQYEMHGMRELRRKLKKLPVNIRKKHSKAALRKAANAVRNDARARISRQTEGTGWIADHIATERIPPWQLRNSDVGIAVGVKLVPGTPPKRHYANRSAKGNLTERFILYWIAHEFGSVKMEKHPFLRPAFYTLTPKNITTIQQHMKKAILFEARTR
jgi:HK97 gp10 family phage protein